MGLGGGDAKGKYNRFYGWTRGKERLEEENNVGREKGDGLRKAMWGKTGRIEGHLRDDMKTQCSENFLKYTKGILMRSPNVGHSPN